jgi:hypothetical protein
MQELVGEPSAFTPDYAPEEMFEIATKLYKGLLGGKGSEKARE